MNTVELPAPFGKLFIYAGGDHYLNVLWIVPPFYEVDFDLRPVLICLLTMSLPFVYTQMKLRRLKCSPKTEPRR